MLLQPNTRDEKHSGIELLKIIAIFLIVINHVTQTLGQENLKINYQDYVIILGNASKEIRIIILTLIRQTGALGNNIFFICSAWFLTGRTKSARKKAFDLFCTVWVISIIYLCIYLIADPTCLTAIDIIKEIMPTTLCNNWYITAYIIFLFMYPLYNKFIAIIDQKQHLRIVLFSSLLWIIIDYLKEDSFFPSLVLSWASIYFLVAYLKLYCKRLIQDKKIGYVLLTVGIFGYIAQVVVTNFIGIYLIGAFADKVLRWNSNYCPFYIMIALGGVIISSQLNFKSKVINYISGLSLFIYLIHENYLFRLYTRPFIWQWIYLNIGYRHIVLIDLLYALILFLAAAIVSTIYQETIQKIVKIVSDKLYTTISGFYRKLENVLIKIR